MKLLRKTTEAFTFELEWLERVELQEVLGRYPLTPLTHYQIARDPASGPQAVDQPLLEEAMAAQQLALRQKVRELLGPGRRFSGDGDHYLLTLSGEDVEWLLQVLNDVRIGCWLQLGCPAEAQPDDPDQLGIGYHLLMETALMFEMVLLQALDEREGGARPEASAEPEP